MIFRLLFRRVCSLFPVPSQTFKIQQQQQQQHKLYLHDYNYVVTVLQKLLHKKKTNKQTNHNNDNAMQ